MSYARGGSSPPIRTNIELMSCFVYDVGILMQSNLVCWKCYVFLSLSYGFPILGIRTSLFLEYLVSGLTTFFLKAALSISFDESAKNPYMGFFVICTAALSF